MNTETAPFTVTPEQRQQLRKDLVAALRSGEFKQGTGRLCRGGLWCCLGIACHVFDRMFPGVLKISAVEDSTLFDDNTSTLPCMVKDAFGFHGEAGPYEQTTLAYQNDCGKSFLEIADLIESNPPGLWVEETEASHA